MTQSADTQRLPKPARPQGAKYEKLAITLPRPIAEAAREQARASKASSLSAFVAEALAEKLERDRLQEVLDETFSAQPMTEEERQWADHLLGL